MSSMWRIAVTIPVLLATAASSSAQYAPPATYAATPTAAVSVASSVNQWRTLRQSSNYRFSDYASFLIANPDWPDSTRMRGWAEKAMLPGENAATVLAFFAARPPKTGSDSASLRDAYAGSGRMADALDAARNAWKSADLSADD